MERITTRQGKHAVELLSSLEDEREAGIRVNTLKTSPTELRHLLSLSLQGIPWCREGLYTSTDERLGKNPLHFAGLYYMQEPSAMYTVEALDVHPGQRVLDLCAAPGGKSTQILAKLQGDGLLVANEINSARARTLAFNLEKFGAHNYMVTNTSADKLAVQLPGYFDRIVVDAPCSGEGMFRKDPDSRENWEPNHPTGCAERQSEILAAAIAMLKVGGILAYSTCTFAEEENEWQVEQLLRAYTELEPLLPPAFPGIDISYSPPCARLLPYLLRGEGHFCALLRKRAGDVAPLPNMFRPINPTTEALLAWQAFAPTASQYNTLHQWGDYLYLVPQVPVLTGIRIERIGLKLGAVIKSRFEPDHTLALAWPALDLPRINLSQSSPELQSYLHGHVLGCEGELKGWVLVCVEGHALGFGKASLGQVKNHFPKGLRLN